MREISDKVKAIISKINILAMDVDGTLTDGKIYIGNEGEAMKVFSVKDGYAIHNLLPKYGVIPIIITGRQSKILENRARELGVKLLYQGVNDKLNLLEKIADERNITIDEVAYIGDDINDLECITKCGFGGCPADAAVEVREKADFIATKSGGEGAVREFIEIILTQKGK